jgi:hypothetical protein
MSVRKVNIVIKKDIQKLFLLLFLTFISVSCWDNFEEHEYISANVLTFGFEQQDTCPGIEYYTFNINQFTGQIYNLDSLPYKSYVDYLLPSITFQSTDGKVYMNDSLWETKDTIDFTKPVILKNNSADGKWTRTYTINVNVHKVDPDSMLVQYLSDKFPTDNARNKIIRLTDGSFKAYFASQTGGLSAWKAIGTSEAWSKQVVSGLNETMNLQSLCVFNSRYFICSESGKLYSSDNGYDWNLSTGRSDFLTLYGSINRKYLNEQYPAYLIGLVKGSSGEVLPAKSYDGLNWTVGSALDADFPVTDYASVKGTNVTGVQFYTVATGLRKDGEFSTSVWSTENGLDWILVQNKTLFPKLYAANKKGAHLFYYDNNLVCLGGVDSKGNFISDLKISKDKGKTWINAPENWILKPLEKGMAYGSVYLESIEDTVNDKNREFMIFFGGQEKSGVSSGIWKSYLNKMIFARI